jgi:hypothetical protein
METPPMTWPFGQPWLPQPDLAFAPGQVTLGLSENELAIRAELHDTHVMQDVFPFNFPAFMQCDAFEISGWPIFLKTLVRSLASWG